MKSLKCLIKLENYLNTCYPAQSLNSPLSLGCFCLEEQVRSVNKLATLENWSSYQLQVEAEGRLNFILKVTLFAKVIR